MVDVWNLDNANVAPVLIEQHFTLNCFQTYPRIIKLYIYFCYITMTGCKIKYIYIYVFILKLHYKGIEKKSILHKRMMVKKNYIYRYI